MENIAKFLETANRLKSVRRSGWVERGVADAESTADHSYMMGLMALALPFGGDRCRVLKMIIVHDLAEAVVGDIISKDNWEGGSHTREEKTGLEREAMKKIVSSLDSKIAKEMMSLWNEFNDGKTREASFARDIDVAERLIQAHAYHRAGNFRKPLEGFWDDSSLSRIKSKSIKALVRNIIGLKQI
jgi:putative hydrolase of HD superfamily